MGITHFFVRSVQSNLFNFCNKNDDMKRSFDQSSVRRITKKLKEIDVDEQLRKKRKVLHRHTPSPQPSTSSESSCSAPEEIEIILRCPNGERLSGKFSNERTPFEILAEAGAIVQYELPLNDSNYDVFVNEVP